MTPERWAKVQELFSAALARTPETRAEFVARECRSDAELSQEVASLLAAHDDAPSQFLESPAIAVIGSAGFAPADPRHLEPGARLGPYEIVSVLGAGGMGAVYRATDTLTEREVALKVLPAEVAADAERLRRFRKEARSASALNHPNIVTVYDVGSSDGVGWIAMELVGGDTLRRILMAGPMAIDDLLSIARQIAEGLAHVHEAGIVHRDLKPENLMITPARMVKILDFGLAKLTGAALGGSVLSTTAVGRTTPGSVLGTIGYMSPEQASGSPIDFRSDQFSFGAILYEMATGRRALETASRRSPEPLRAIIDRCLTWSADSRYASTRDLVRDLARVEGRLTATRSDAISGESS